MSQTKVARSASGSSQRLSSIPLVAPRPTTRKVSSVATALSSSPTSIQTSAASDPSAVAMARDPSSSPPTSSANTSASGIPALRALRSLLPFGPGRPSTAVASSSPPPTKASSFMNFTSVRKSMSGERKNSLSYARPSGDDFVDEASPVISIRASTTSMDEDLRVKSSNDRESHVRRELDSTARPFHTTSAGKSLASGSPLPTELSTIIEADTSGISKYIPSLDDSRSNDSLNLQPSSSIPPKPNQPKTSLQSIDPTSAGRDGDQSLDALDDSVLDLSTSRLQIEVREALFAKGYKGAAKWLEEGALGAVDDAEQSSVEDSRHDCSAARTSGEYQNLSFNLAALDPELAELLGPNSGGLVPKTHMPISKSLGLTPTASPGSQKESTRHPGFATSQSSPVHRSFLTPASSRVPSSSSLPRLRPNTSHSTPSQSNKELPLLPPAAIYPETPSSDNATRQGSFDSLRLHPSPSSTSTSNVPSYRKSATSRVMTPIRHATNSSAIGKKLRVRPSLVPTLPNGVNIEPETPSPPEASVSLGSSSATRLLSQARASLDDLSRNEGTGVERRRPSLLRSRKRSMSLEAQRIVPAPLPPRTPYIRPSSSLSAARPGMDWLGPRTAKAFAAAGLIDSHDDSSTTVSRSTSRAGLARSGSERNARVQQRATSRIAISETSGSNSSWGRSGSISHTVTTSEAGGVYIESPTLSIPRTNFSSASTAPTSVSAFSISTTQQLQATIQTMKERHDLETEALLAALSDSQQASKVLRVENTELRVRIQQLEDQLEEVRMIALRCQTAHNTLLPRPLSLNSRSRANSADDVHRLHPSSSFNSSSNTTFVKTHERHDSTSRIPSTYDLSSKTQPKRVSTTSSIFPTPPSNMTMLMTEEGIISGGFSSRSISPPISAPPLATRIRHSHKRSVSSGGNVSPTTVNFSVTELTGSPGSLCLRPEHEIHLGDMVSLDLSYNPDDGHDADLT